MSILDDLADSNRRLVAEARERVSLHEMRERAEALDANTGFPFDSHLRAPGLSVIAECKQASPSRGQIARHGYPYVDIARAYEAGGAAAISCLTEPTRFKGSTRHLRDIAAAVSIPVLRKDFIIDPYQIYEAKVLGASAVLLICAILDERSLEQLHRLARSLGLSVLVEAHNAEEIAMAVRVGASVIGVNNRDLRDFTVDTTNASSLRDEVPEDIVFVAESGVHGADDAAALAERGVDAILVGEALMRATDPATKVRELLSASVGVGVRGGASGANEGESGVGDRPSEVHEGASDRREAR